MEIHDSRPVDYRWHIMMMAITRADSTNVCNTRAYDSADYDTDHSLVASCVKVTPKRPHHIKKCQPRINTNQTLDPEKNASFIHRR